LTPKIRESPDILRPFDPRELDSYIHKLSKLKKSFSLSNDVKKVKPAKPKLTLPKKSLGELRSDLQNVLKQEEFSSDE
jgi:hypothetical protein